MSELSQRRFVRERRSVFSLLPKWMLPYRPLVRRVRRHSVIGVGATVGAAGFEALGLATLGLFATRQYEGAAAALAVAGAISGLLISSSLAKALSDQQLATGQVKLETSLRAQVTDAILHADWQDFVDQPGHELQSAAISEAPQVAQATFTLVRGGAAIASATIVFASTLFVSRVAALICVLFGAAIVFAYSRSSQALSGIQRELAEGNTELTRHTSILISGLRSLRLSPVQAAWREDLRAAFERHARARRRDLLIPVRGRLIVEILAGTMILAVLTAQVEVSGELLPGLVVMALILRTMPRVQSAQQLLTFARHGVLWVDRWNTRLDSLTLMPEAGLTWPRSPTPESEGVALKLENVSFSYRRHERPVLTEVDLELRQGEWVSLRGVSGGGKSSLIDVIGGILVPTTGTVSLNGRPIQSYDASTLYSTLVIVPQDVHLLGRTVPEILTWGGRLRTTDHVQAISGALGVDEMFLFTDQRPDDRMDEMSRDISGGMRTRLAMARALASTPSVLILDETMSRLHPEAEAGIFQAVRGLRPDLAVLVVTHRQETTDLVDRRLQLVDGRLRPDD